MRILMLNYEYPPLGGGAANANKYILDGLKDSNIKIDLITSSPKGYAEEELSDNITIYKLDVRKNYIHHWRNIEILLYMFKGYLKANELKKNNNYDLIHSWFGFPCGFMAKLLKIPYIVSLRGSDVPGYNKRFSWIYIFLKPVIKSVWISAEEVIPNSLGLRRLAKKTLKINMKIINNGVDISEFSPSYNNNKEYLQILCVSRLTSRKRIIDLVKAIKDLEDVKLKIIGEGEEKQNLKTAAENLGLMKKIKFAGYMPHDKLHEEYQKADVFVLPSLREGMSNTLLEAMASGLPLITTRTGGTDELIRENGFLVPKKSPEAISIKISRYQNNQKLMNRHGKNSREIAENMSWSKVVDQYKDLYRNFKRNSKKYEENH